MSKTVKPSWSFPVTKTAIAVLVTCAIMTIFCFSIYFLKEEQRTLAASQKRISWLKFESRVSNFPATKTALRFWLLLLLKQIFCFSIYFLNAGSFAKANLMVLCQFFFFYFFLLLFAKVVQSMWRALHQWAVVFERMMSV